MRDHSFPFEVPSVTPVRPWLDADRCGVPVAGSRTLSRLGAGLVLGIWLLVNMTADGVAQPQALSSSTSSTTDPVTLSGQVINSVTGVPIPRALVRFNNRAMLTDHEGKFRFEQVTGLQFGQTTSTFVNLQVTKPGYYASSDPMDPGNQSFQL